VVVVKISGVVMGYMIKVQSSSIEQRQNGMKNAKQTHKKMK
jgi:hypothetical protein